MAADTETGNTSGKIDGLLKNSKLVASDYVVIAVYFVIVLAVGIWV